MYTPPLRGLSLAFGIWASLLTCSGLVLVWMIGVEMNWSVSRGRLVVGGERRRVGCEGYVIGGVWRGVDNLGWVVEGEWR